MIYAVTLNPAIDKYIDVDNFILNNTNYYEKEINRFGGKAINVAKMLNNFTNDYQLVTKTSITTNDLINQDLVDINKKLFNTNKIRTNYKINANGVITELNQNLFDSASINSSLKIFEYLKQQVTSKDIIIFSGSMTEMEIKEMIEHQINAQQRTLEQAPDIVAVHRAQGSIAVLRQLKLLRDEINATK